MFHKVCSEKIILEIVVENLFQKVCSKIHFMQYKNLMPKIQFQKTYSTDFFFRKFY